MTTPIVLNAFVKGIFPADSKGLTKEHFDVSETAKKVQYDLDVKDLADKQA